MRIQRSASLILRQVTQSSFKKAAVATLSVIAIAAFAVIGQNLLTHPTDSYAAQEIHGCYAFDVDDETIYSYFNNEGNDDANPTCSRDLVIPATIDGIPVTHINDGAFYGKSLTSVTIPTSVTSIGTAGFIDNNLTSVTIPGSVESIGDVAFSNNQLTSLLVQSGVSSIGERAFAGNQLTSVTLEDGLSTIGVRAFYDNPLTSLVIPNGVTSIADETFMQSQLTSVTISSSVTSIGDMAFRNNQLTSLVLQNGMSGIGEFAFSDNSLTSVNIPGSAADIGYYAFFNNQLTSVTIEDGVTGIGDYSFMNNHITSLTIPSSVTTVGELAFYDNELGSLVIEDGVTSISDTAFGGNNLTSVSIPGSVKSIGTSAFVSNNLVSLTLHEGTQSIDRYAFADNQLTSLTIPDSVTTIGGGAFTTNQLTAVTLGDGMTAIEDQAFAFNTLTSVAVPDSITSINPTAFFGQNPWGGDIDQGDDPTHNWSSDDPAVVKYVYDNIWYAQLYTASPNNPNHLTDGFATEAWWYDDLNGDGDENDSLGTHLINPASLSVTYVNSKNQPLASTYTSTGQLADGTNLTNYLVKNTELPVIEDIDALTPEEQTALDASLSAYYRTGQRIRLDAPIITGYQQPSSPFSLLLTAAQTDHVFTYKPLSAQTPEPVKSPEKKPTASSPTQTPPATRATPQEATSTDQIELRSKVDFAALVDSATGPARGAVPTDLSTIMAKGSFATDTTKSCAQITSATLLPSTSFTAPDAGSQVLGGLAFTLRCDSDGGEAKVTFTFGDTIADITKIKVYKQDRAGKIRDITSMVNLVSQTANGRATLSYTLKDGQDLDDDGEVNSSISDPIYLTLAGDSQAPETTALNQAAPTSENRDNTVLFAVAGSIIGLTALTLVVSMVRRNKRA